MTRRTNLIFLSLAILSIAYALPTGQKIPDRFARDPKIDEDRLFAANIVRDSGDNDGHVVVGSG